MEDISKRMEAARQKPGYSRAVFDSFLTEAREAVGDFPEFLEFMGPYLPLGTTTTAPSADRPEPSRNAPARG